MKFARILLHCMAFCFAYIFPSSAADRDQSLFVVVPALGGPNWEPVVIRVDDFVSISKKFEAGDITNITVMWEALKSNRELRLEARRRLMYRWPAKQY